MNKKDDEKDKPKQKTKYVLKIVGATGICGTVGIVNHFLEIIKPEDIFLIVLFALCFILVCLVLLQDAILKVIDRICRCIEHIVKFREETKRASVGSGKGDSDDDDGDCKIYEMHRMRK